MILAVIAGVAFVSTWITGWRLDLKSQEITQIALLQIESRPSGAKIYLNGDLQGFTTPGRHEMGVGLADIKVSMDGYHDWTKQINLKATEVRWLNYIRLVPKEIKTTDILNLGIVDNVLVSPDKKWLMITQPEGRNLKLVDIGDINNIKMTDFILPTNITGEKFSLLEWHKDSTFLLISNDKGDIIRLDRRDAGVAINLSDEIKTSMTNVRFSGDENLVYGITEGNLRRIDIADKTISDPLIKSVSNFNYYNNRIIYVAKIADSKTEVGVFQNNQKIVIKRFDDEESVNVRFSHYFYRDYMTIVHGEDILILENPLAEKPKVVKELKFTSGVNALDVNSNGRFILAWRDGQTVVYDIETNETFKFNTGNSTERPRWFNEYHLSVIIDGVITMMDFDGANKRSLVAGRNLPILSGNQQFLLSIKNTEDGAKLQRSNMTVQQK